MTRTKKTEKPVVSGNATDIIGLFEAEGRTIKMDDRGRVTIARHGKPSILVYVGMDGQIVISGDDTITIAPRASNMIRIL